jgi:hypothetical protein
MTQLLRNTQRASAHPPHAKGRVRAQTPDGLIPVRLKNILSYLAGARNFMSPGRICDLGELASLRFAGSTCSLVTPVIKRRLSRPQSHG